MIRKLFAVFLLGLSVSSFGQQIPMYNQYHIAPRVYNPSYVGFNEGVNIALVRNQKWGDYDEGFITNYLSASFLLKEKHGLGINLYNDYVGITSKLKAHLLYSYKLKMFEDGKGRIGNMQFGAGVGIVDNRIDLAGSTVSDPNDPILLAGGKDRRTMFDMNVGLNFSYAGLRVGVSVPQVLGTKLNYGDLAGSYYTLERQYLSNIGFTWRLSDTTDGKLGMSLRPEALVMLSPGAPFQYNGGLFFEMDKYFWIGGMYKSNYAVGINVGINLVKNLKIGLAYDFQISSYASFNSAPNGELLLRYNIPPKRESFAVIDTAALAEKDRIIDSLGREINNKENVIDRQELTIEQQKRIIDSLLNVKPVIVEKVDTSDNKTIKQDPKDYFIELSGADTKDGYYLISGVFSEKKNADGRIRRIKSKFPSARIIKNKRNDLFYVMLYYSTKKDESLAYESYKAAQLPDKDSWILDYKKPE